MTVRKRSDAASQRIATVQGQTIPSGLARAGADTIMERCPNCGASIRTGARFCTACGFRLIQPADSPAVTNPVAAVLEPSPSIAPERSERTPWQPERADTAPSAEDPDATASPDSSPGTAPKTVIDHEPGAEMSEASVDPRPGSRSSESDIDDRGSRPGAVTDVEDVQDRSSHLEKDDETASAPISMNGQPETIAHDSEPAASSVSTDNQDESTAASVDQAEREDGQSGSTSPSDDTQPAGNPDEHRASDLMSTVEVDEGDQEATGVSYPWESVSAEPIALQLHDDVMLGTTFVQESAQPGYYDNAGERPSLTGDITRAPDAADQTVDAEAGEPKGAPPEIGSDTSSAPQAVSPDDQVGGMDSDWEPWGAGGTAPDEPGSADTNGTVFSDLTTARIRDQGDADTAPSGLVRARMLLEELQTIVAEMEKPAEQTAIDPAAQASIESMAELGQLLDGFPNSTPGPEALGELTRLAEDLAGRDYDIRALQRFAQERELILELATIFEQQRDLLEQIRSILPTPQR